MLIGKGKGNDIAPLFRPWSGEFTSFTVQEALTAVINLPPCPGFHQIPAFTLSVFELSACQVAQYSCVLSQVPGWISEFQILGTQCSVDPHQSSGGGSCHTVACTG